jgi:hypothetical protein
MSHNRKVSRQLTMVWGLSRFYWHRYSAKKACTWGAIKWLGMRITSCVGIGLEAVCGGAQEFRDGRQVPITFVRVDVPEVDREVGQ